MREDEGMSVEFWIGTRESLLDEVIPGASRDDVQILSEGTLWSDDISRWVGCDKLPPGQMFTLRAPIEGDGSSRWVQYEGGSWAPERDMYAIRIERP